jgi:putative tricarboxylic transport membrane protein
MRPLTIFAASLLSALATLPATAQSELKIMAPAGPGGGWDQTARAMQQALISSQLAKSVQVFNVTGAGGSVGLAQLINSKGEGRLLMVNGLVMVGALLTNKSAVRLDQATPIAKLTEEVEVIVVPAASPIKNAADLAAAVKADPAKVTWTGGSAGGVDHITAAMFAQAAGADASKINYIAFSGGGESLAAVLGGRVTAGISGYGEYEGQIKSGRLRLIGVTADKRIAGIDGPTLKEQGIDLVISNWRSVMAPPGLTPQQRDDLTALVEKMANSPAWKEILKQKGWDDALMTGEAFANFLKSEQVRVAGVLKSAGLVKP